MKNFSINELPPLQKSSFNQFAEGNANKIQAIKTKNLWQKFIALPAYYWVLLATVSVILPHLSYLPIWLIIYGLFSVAMQLPQVRAKFRKHGTKRLKTYYRIVQLVGLLLGFFGLWYSFRSIGVELSISFLLLCLASKLWEMFGRRDALIVLNLSLFVCASLFLLDQSLGNSLIALLSVLTVMMAFIAMNDDDNKDGSGRVRSLGLLLGLALPLLVVLFLFFPRLPPLWSLHLASSQAKTGMSDSMSAGDFANLSQSTELAFRVEFAENAKIPPRQQMYWRGLVLSNFDGKTWTVNRQKISFWQEKQTKPQWLINAENSTKNAKINYKVILEPTNQPWLLALDYPTTIHKESLLSSNFTLNSIEPISQQISYQANFQPNMKINQQLSAEERAINLALPTKSNPRSRQFAQQLYKKSGNVTNYINTLANWINQDKFRYTLSPPLLNKNRIDEFLFETQAGFCEHYASTFTYLMRAVGIPSRVVIGYQGGKLGRDGKSWEVRQMDAHAWVEVWLENQGWVRIDPTSFVAPERVEKGMDELTNEQGSAMFGDGVVAELSYQQFKMLQKLRRLSDQMSYYWQRDIVGYDQEKQQGSLFKWLNIKNIYQQLLLLIGMTFATVALIMLWLWWKRRPTWHIADRELMKLSKKLAKINPQLAKAENEGMLAWLERLSDFSEVDKQVIKTIENHYRKLRYSEFSQQSIKNHDYQNEVKKLNNVVKKILVNE